MRRINITFKNARITKSFSNVNEFAEFLFEKLNFSNPDETAESIWDLDVGSKLECDGFIFSIQSKQRIGSQLHDGSTIGK